jgi:hypothetical protein
MRNTPANRRMTRSSSQTADVNDVARRWTGADERSHTGAQEEEWTFSFWSPDGSIAGFTSYRLVGTGDAWYCWALARRGRSLLHVTEFDIPRRSDPMIAKAQAMWSEYTCEAPFEQWTVGNETYAVGLEDPEEALGRIYGEAVPIASDIEWYATGDPQPLDHGGDDELFYGYEQVGVVHGAVELVDGGLDLEELPAHRTHRWIFDGPLPPLRLATAVAHLGVRVPFRFPDNSVLDLVLTADGWRRRT